MTKRERRVGPDARKALKQKTPTSTTPGKPVRPKKALERFEPWLILALAVAAAITALELFGLKYLQKNKPGSGSAGYLLISLLGMVALGLILSTFFYSLRKRRRTLQEHMPGTMMMWFKSHIYLGLLAGLAALVHAAVRPYTPNLSTGKVALAILILLVISGIAWRAVYFLVPPRVAKRVGNLAVTDTERRLTEVAVEIDKLAAGKSDQFQAGVSQLLAGKGQPEVLERLVASLGPNERGDWEQVKTLAGRRERYLRRETRQRRYARFMQAWKLLHLPLAAILFGAIAVHLLDVFGVTRSVVGGKEAAFSSSAQCGSCHTDIAAQLRRAAHSHAEVSPFMIAQTALALKKDSGWGQICVNCHAPIGSQITGKDTLPFSSNGAHSFDGVLNEGVNCVDCHTQIHIPAELLGASGIPVQQRGSTSLGTMVGPPLTNPGPLPQPDHNITTGFMTSDVASAQLCGACHDVKVELKDANGKFDGIAAIPGSEGKFVDKKTLDIATGVVSNGGNGILDQNEYRVDPNGPNALTNNTQTDVILQTTFDEWQNFIFDSGGSGASCVTCHMPNTSGPLVRAAPIGLSLPDRVYAQHIFVGTDYDLTPGHPGLTDAEFRQVLADRAALLKTAATIQVKVVRVNKRQMTVNVHVAPGFIGHDLPTGFAFVRQMWLQVSATTASGNDVCLAPDPHGIRSPCQSGLLKNPQQDLRPCDPTKVGLANSNIVLTRRFPLTNCDPWLANWQKILTDGDPKHTGTFREVPFQSLQPGLVKFQVRVADQQIMLPMHPPPEPVDPNFEDFQYTFDVSAVRGQKVTVKAVLNFRHLPPYFIQGLNGFYPPPLTPQQLLTGLVVVAMTDASTAPTVIP